MLPPLSEQIFKSLLNYKRHSSFAGCSLPKAFISTIFAITAGITTAFGITVYEQTYKSTDYPRPKFKSSPTQLIFKQLRSSSLIPTIGTLCESLSMEEGTSRNPELRPYRDVLDPTSFQRMEIPARGTASSHAVFGALSRDEMIEQYNVFRNEKIPVDIMTSNSWSLQGDLGTEITVAAVVKIGKSLDGHEGIVHGGILALLIDDVIGFGYEALSIPMAFTANLNINFLAPVEAGSKLLVTAALTSREGRKLYWKVQVSDCINGKKHVFCEATSLYIIPRNLSKL